MNAACGNEPILVILAGGSSSRFEKGKKEYLKMEGGTVLSTAASVFFKAAEFCVAAVSFPESESEENAKNALFCDSRIQKAKERGTEFIFAKGGKTRQESVKNALEAAAKIVGENSSRIVLIHDGARPFVSEKIVQSVLRAAAEFGAAAPGIAPTDTQKEISGNGFVARHLRRNSLVSIQTPQGFVFSKILSAHRKAAQTDAEFTDDTEIWDKFSSQNNVKIVQGSSENRKITYKNDYSEEKMEIRTGLGYDKHRLVPNRALVIGGVKIESDLGEDGHSDGDALLHAVTDAVLGAAAIGDIGSFFPPSDEKWKDADSKNLLSIAWKKVKESGWKIENLDCAVLLESPKFLPYREKVCETIAQILETDKSRVFVKAKTGEKIGEVGERRAIEAFATCLLSR